MASNAQSPRGEIDRLRRPVWFLVGALFLGLAVVVIVLGTRAREAGREQLLSRDAELVEAIFLREWDEFRSSIARSGAVLEREDFLILASTVGDLRGVVGVAVYSPDGREQWASFPTLRSAPLERPAAAHGRAIARWHPEIPLDALFAESDPAAAVSRSDFVEVQVAARDGRGTDLAWVQYWFDGTSVRSEFDALDRRLWGQGVSIFVVVALFILVLGSIASRRIRTIGRELEEGRRSLEKANAELELAARASVVGAISAHLLHGLKNPLGGLRSYLRAHGGSDEARAAADRMQRLIQETLQVLREEKRQSAMLTLDEFAEEIRRKFTAGAQDGLLLEVSPWGSIAEGLRVGSFEVRLAMLILENLICNAIAASPYPVVVSVSGKEQNNGSDLLLEVRDNGPGVPPEIVETLFEPGVRGPGEGTGAGLGLALSRHLARAMGGDLRLVHTDQKGAVFSLRMPFVPTSILNPTRS